MYAKSPQYDNDKINIFLCYYQSPLHFSPENSQRIICVSRDTLKIEQLHMTSNVQQYTNERLNGCLYQLKEN